MPIVDITNRPDKNPASDLLSTAFSRNEEARAGINEFFDDPQRQTEIDEVVGVGLDRALRTIGNQIRNRAQQEAFARARSGNIGGSFQATQGAQLNADAMTAGAQASGAADQQRFTLEQQLENQRQQELLQNFGIDPMTQQAIAAMLTGLNVQGAGNQAAFALNQQRRDQEAFANDELSRAFGNVLNLGGNAFTTDQMAQAFGRQGVF